MAFDPRLYQIAALSSLLLYGVLTLAFDVSASQVVLILVSALGFQFLFSKIARLPRVEYRSAMISGLSLCLLLRTADLRLAFLGALLTIGSKFVIRLRGKHLFNPTNFGIVALLLGTKQAWVSPGQWGSGALFGFFLACAGGVVVFRALRSDTALSFLLFYPGLLLFRALRLGDPLSIPLHQLENGALLIFAFFMISDPKTTPDTRAGRLIFTALVAYTAYWIRFTYYTPNALLYSLCACSVAVPLIDSLLKGQRYIWPGTAPAAG